MKKILTLFIVIILVLSGCNNRNSFTLKGSLSDLPSDTILVFYQEPHYKLDTIIAQKGKFNYTIIPDTLTIFSLIFNEEEVLPIYADKGKEVMLEGNLNKIQIKGEGENERMNQIRQKISSLSTDKSAIKLIVDSLIQNNPHSYTNIYLIDKYYVQDSLPDYKHINQLVKGLSGNIKDSPYMIALQTKLDEYTNFENSRSLTNLYYTDKKGKVVDWSSIKDKYVLLDFWASWNQESVTAQDSLVPVLKALKKEKFIIVSVSLDMDKDAWLNACDRDTLQWKQVCDFKGWNNNLVKQQNITQIPANLLISPDQRIIARNLCGKELTEKVKQLIQQDKEKEKSAKEAERAQKRKKKK